MRSEFEKNRYWVGLFKTDVEFNALLGEFGRYELNGSRRVDHGYLEDFNSKWEAYAEAWQHQQTKVDELKKQKSLQELEINQIAQANQQWKLKCDELQKRVDAVKQLIKDYKDPSITSDKSFQHGLLLVADELEQALKGGGE